MKKLLFFLGFSVCILTGCEQDTLVGFWVRPVVGQENQFQGMVLRKDGTASSVNIDSFYYETWKRQDDFLILTGKSVYDNESVAIKEEYKIEMSDKNSLDLKMGNTVFHYVRKK